MMDVGKSHWIPNVETRFIASLHFFLLLALPLFGFAASGISASLRLASSPMPYAQTMRFIASKHADNFTGVVPRNSPSASIGMGTPVCVISIFSK